MHVTDSAISLNVADVEASAAWARETEPWGERYFQMADPNGVVFQLVQWVEAPDPQYAG